MAIVTGILGLLTSWGSSSDIYTQLVANNKAAEFTLDLREDTADRTTFVSGGAPFARNIKALHSWDGKIQSHLGTPQTGAFSNVTFSSGYTANVYAYDIQISADVHDVTTMVGSSGVKWKAWTPGLVKVSGTFECFADGTTAIAGPGLDAEAASATFDVVAGASGKTLSGSIITTGASLSVSASGKPNTVKYTWVMDSQLSTAGSGTLLWSVDAGGGTYSITTPLTGKTITLQSYTGQTYSGTAFWKGLSIKCALNSPVMLGIDFQGTGALTGPTGIA